ncbi:hypothetical protein BS47DRAFT_1366763 [Hydnum rufescens UP504]|uniref:Uncharacterized protein n=1 Tax=Hydnum rufescens UP504 TaxID=1448309 RepID=A0A9P6AKX0_9AGAM|nr:hypothetical protein BS47DRAFT_1366763 [Hydnum rufescens UP504]
MLEFVASLFLHTAPNERAWAMTLVEYLKAHGYEFATGDSFQQRFANALVHYQVLVWLVRAEITRIVQDDKRGLISELDERMLVHEQGYLNVQSDPKLFANSTPTNASVNAPATVLTRRDRGMRSPSHFTQDNHVVEGLFGVLGKENPGDFILQGQHAWDRNAQPMRAPIITQIAREDDTVEPGLHALNSAYDACQQSLLLQMKITKEAVLCLVLLDTILKHMDQTLKKWRFMLEWLPCLGGVSIFHAYGHQWACQLWYHPHKSELWGLSDGEGCERFWSELRRLIPGLWVTGYHRHLFILDLQVEHIDEGKHMGMGKWLQGRIDRLQHCLEEAEMKLGDRSPSYLMEQFKAQREYHSQPVSCQSQTKGARAVEQIISLTATLEAQRGNLKDLIAEGNDLVQDDMTASNEVQAEWQEKVRLLKEAIRLKKDKWVNIQLNLRALHEQLLKKLRARKFELATLDHANSSRILDQKTKAHVEKAVKNQSGGIDATVKKYNARLKELVALRGRGGIWRDAYIPPMLTMDGLYKLDVDQDIWEDSRGDIVDFPDGVVPPWLADPSVKEGIRISQEVASCQQELERCKGEHANLWMWFHEEYSAAMDLFMGSKDEDVSYFGLLWAHQLYDWMTAWKKDIVQVPIAPGAPSWDLSNVRVQLEQESLVATTTPPCLDHNSQSRRNLDDFDARSDDDLEGGELEEFFELEEAGLIAAVDQAIVELDLDSE